VIWYFHFGAPAPGEHVLNAKRKKLRLDPFIIVVFRGSLGGPAPVAVLVLVIEVQERHAALVRGKHGTGAHVKDTTPAGAGPDVLRRQQRRQQSAGNNGQLRT